MENTQGRVQEKRTAADDGIYAHLEKCVTRMELIFKERDMRGQHKHLKNSVGLDGRQAGGQEFVKERLEWFTAEDRGRDSPTVGEVLLLSPQRSIFHMNPSIFEEVKQRDRRHRQPETRYTCGRHQHWRRLEWQQGGWTTRRRRAILHYGQSYSTSTAQTSPDRYRTLPRHPLRRVERGGGAQDGNMPPSKSSTRRCVGSIQP